MLYLDNNATTRPAPEVADAVNAALTEFWHNPSSIHRAGQAARRRVELARKSVAQLIGARPKSITFTGSGTESIDLAIRGSVLTSGRRAVVTTDLEHNAIRALCETLGSRDGIDIRHLRLGADGRVDLEHLGSVVDDGVAVVSVQWANNETGHIQPVDEIGRLCQSRGVTFHCDATQWVGKAPTNVGSAPIDLMTFSAHKFHGPKGVGVLYIRPGVSVTSVIHGEQELGRRGGTENVPGIVGLGVAADLARAWLENPDNVRRAAAVRDRFEQTVCRLVPGAKANAPAEAAGRLWNTSNIAFAGLEAEAILFLLSERGVCASAGSACSSGSLAPSPVLKAIGVPPETAAGSIRFSICRETTQAEADEAARIVAESVARLRACAAESSDLAAAS